MADAKHGSTKEQTRSHGWKTARTELSRVGQRGKNKGMADAATALLQVVKAKKAGTHGFTSHLTTSTSGREEAASGTRKPARSLLDSGQAPKPSSRVQVAVVKGNQSVKAGGLCSRTRNKQAAITAFRKARSESNKQKTEALEDNEQEQESDLSEDEHQAGEVKSQDEESNNDEIIHEKRTQNLPQIASHAKKRNENSDLKTKENIQRRKLRALENTRQGRKRSKRQASGKIDHGRYLKDVEAAGKRETNMPGSRYESRPYDGTSDDSESDPQGDFNDDVVDEENVHDYVTYISDDGDEDDNNNSDIEKKDLYSQKLPRNRNIGKQQGTSRHNFPPSKLSQSSKWSVTNNNAQTRNPGETNQKMVSARIEIINESTDDTVSRLDSGDIASKRKPFLHRTTSHRSLDAFTPTIIIEDFSSFKRRPNPDYTTVATENDHTGSRQDTKFTEDNALEKNVRGKSNSSTKEYGKSHKNKQRGGYKRNKAAERQEERRVPFKDEEYAQERITDHPNVQKRPNNKLSVDKNEQNGTNQDHIRKTSKPETRDHTPGNKQTTSDQKSQIEQSSDESDGDVNRYHHGYLRNDHGIPRNKQSDRINDISRHDRVDNKQASKTGKIKNESRHENINLENTTEATPQIYPSTSKTRKLDEDEESDVFEDMNDKSQVHDEVIQKFNETDSDSLKEKQKTITKLIMKKDKSKKLNGSSTKLKQKNGRPEIETSPNDNTKKERAHIDQARTRDNSSKQQIVFPSKDHITLEGKEHQKNPARVVIGPFSEHSRSKTNNKSGQTRSKWAATYRKIKSYLHKNPRAGKGYLKNPEPGSHHQNSEVANSFNVSPQEGKDHKIINMTHMDNQNNHSKPKDHQIKTTSNDYLNTIVSNRDHQNTPIPNRDHLMNSAANRDNMDNSFNGYQINTETSKDYWKTPERIKEYHGKPVTTRDQANSSTAGNDHNHYSISNMDFHENVVARKDNWTSPVLNRYHQAYYHGNQDYIPLSDNDHDQRVKAVIWQGSWEDNQDPHKIQQAIHLPESEIDSDKLWFSRNGRDNRISTNAPHFPESPFVSGKSDTQMKLPFQNERVIVSKRTFGQALRSNDVYQNINTHLGMKKESGSDAAVANNRSSMILKDVSSGFTIKSQLFGPYRTDRPSLVPIGREGKDTVRLENHAYNGNYKETCSPNWPSRPRQRSSLEAAGESSNRQLTQNDRYASVIDSNQHEGYTVYAITNGKLDLNTGNDDVYYEDLKGTTEAMDK